MKAALGHDASYDVRIQCLKVFHKRSTKKTHFLKNREAVRTDTMAFVLDCFGCNNHKKKAWR